MKRTCEGCKALYPKNQYEIGCILRYPVDSLKHKPLKECPKPTTNIGLCNAEKYIGGV